jgi:hypothetical protein
MTSMTDKQIQVTYKETSLGFTVLNGETNIHTEDANLLLQQGWFAASMLNDLDGFRVSEDGDKITVLGEGTAWRRIVDTYSTHFDSGYLVDPKSKKLLAFA